MSGNKCIVCKKKIPLEEGNLCTQCEEKGDFAISGINDDLKCGTCKFIVEEDCEGLVCDKCSSWYHNHCNENPLKEALYGLLNEAPNNVKWFCDKCIWETEKWIQGYKDGKGSGRGYCKKGEYDPVYNPDPKEPEIKIEVENEEIPFDIGDSGSNFSDYEEEIKNNKKKKTGKKKPYKCSQCEKAFACKSSLKKHIDKLNHHDLKSYPCKYCEECFTNRGDLKTHSQTHPEYNLKIENGEMSDEFELNETTNTENTKETKKGKKRSRGIKKYQCSKCERKFKNEKSYEKHMETCDHDGTKGYPCKHCEEIFTNKGDRRKHLKSHSKNKVLQCSTCGKVFRQQDHLTRHETIHTGEKPHQCGYCGRFFARRDHMLKHERIHTGEKPHACQYCGKVFARRDNLKTHERGHTGEKPYQCDKCEKVFMNKSNLTQHLKTHDENKTFQHTSPKIDLPIFTKRKSTIPVPTTPAINQRKSAIITPPIFTKRKPTPPVSTSTLSSPTKLSHSLHNSSMTSTTDTTHQSHNLNNSNSTSNTSLHQVPINMMAAQPFSYPPRPMPSLQNPMVSFPPRTQHSIQQSSMSPANASFRDLCSTPTSPGPYSMETPQNQAQPLNLESMHTYKIEGGSQSQPLNADPMHTSYMSFYPMPTNIPTHSGSEPYQLTILDGRHESLK